MFVSARVPSEEVYPVWTGASNDARNRPHAPETTLAYNCPMDRLVDKTAILLACVLLGMGVTSLSMAASAVSSVGAQISAVSFAQCEAAAAAMKDARDAKHARLLATEALGIK